MRTITLKYGGECRKCGADLSAGQEAGYEKHVGIFCPGCTPQDREEVRTVRQEMADRYAERLEVRAGRLDIQAEGKMAEFNHCRQDWAWVTQPGHTPGRQKAVDRYNRGAELSTEAHDLRERAERVSRGVRVAGDAETERQAVRDKNDGLIKVGSRVHDFAFGLGIIVRVHKKSYSIKFDGSGNTYARDKSYVRPIEEPEKKAQKVL